MTSPSRPQSNPAQLLLLAIVGLLALTLWYQQKEAKRIATEYEGITRMNEEFHQKKVLPAASAPAMAQPATAVPAPVSQPPAEQVATQPSPETPAPVEKPGAAQPETMVRTPTGFAPPPKESGLALVGTHVAPIDGGLRTTLQFNPSTTDPIGLVAIVVRLPADGDARILDLNPAGTMKFSDVAQRVSDDGKFAVFQGTPESIAAIEFALSVSGPAVADVRGTSGIGAFDLKVGPTGADVTPK